MLALGCKTLALLGLAPKCGSDAGHTCCMHNRAAGHIGLNSPSTEQVASFDVGTAWVNCGTATFQVARVRSAAANFDGLRAFVAAVCGPRGWEGIGQ